MFHKKKKTYVHIGLRVCIEQESISAILLTQMKLQTTIT